MPITEDGHTASTWMKVEEIILMILDNDLLFKKEYSEEFTATVMEKYNVAERQANRYIALAKAKVRKIKAEITKKEFEHHFAKAIVDREWMIRAAKLIYTETKNTNDLAKALDGMKDRDKLLDLYPDQKVKNENVNYDFDPSKFTEKGLERLKRGDDIQSVLLDPESVKIPK